jgi:hypothetical protein
MTHRLWHPQYSYSIRETIDDNRFEAGQSDDNVKEGSDWLQFLVLV